MDKTTYQCELQKPHNHCFWILHSSMATGDERIPYIALHDLTEIL